MTYMDTPTTRPVAQKTFNPIKWLFHLEADYRQARTLEAADETQLQDMGLTREQSNTAFYGRFGQNRYYAKAN